MPESSQRIAILINKHLRNELSNEERLELGEWLNDPENKQLFEQLTREDSLEKELTAFLASKNNTWEKIQNGIAREETISVSRRKSWIGVAAAIAIFLILSAGLYIGLTNRRAVKTISQNPVTPVLLRDVTAPSSTHAILTLSNGRQITLDSAGRGSLAMEANVNITRLADGSIIYKGVADAEAKTIYHTITNPKGSRPLSLTLPDNTLLWLNTASSITYCVGGFADKERRVDMTGEAYFEVTKNKSYPFRVNVVNKGEITVLGTHFNVNAYNDEATINTTLLEGSIKFTDLATHNSQLISPGQQARLHRSGGMNIVSNINTEEVMAWRNNQFLFKSADITTLMRQASRWYDLEIVYDKGIPVDRFNGGFSKNVTLLDFLKILEYSEVKFRLEEGERQEKKLIITRK